MTDKDTALRLALEFISSISPAFICEASHHKKHEQHASNETCPHVAKQKKVYEAIKAALANEALERKAENARELGLDYEPYGFEASMYPRVIIDPVTGNVSIGTVTKACGLECDCTDVCKQDDYKALWQQMCERCDELDKKLAQQEAKDEPVAWRDAAIRLGEELSSVGPDGYYDMDAKKWLDWAMKQNPRGEHSLPQRKPLTDEQAKDLLKHSDLLDMFEHIGWYSAPKNGFNKHGISLIRAIEAAHGIKGGA